MDSLVQARIRDYLKYKLAMNPYDCGAVVARIRELARAAGYGLDERFAYAGLSSGPEGRLASAIVARALGKSGTATSEHDVRLAVERWIRQKPAMGT